MINDIIKVLSMKSKIKSAPIEPLNDKQLIQHLQKELAKANKAFFIASILFVISIIFIGILGDNLEHFKEENEKYKVELIEQEAILSLEYSIGFWFIHTPEKLTDSTLYELLKENGAWYPDILLKQAKLESSNYNSKLCRNNNNIYGMKEVHSRPTTQRGGRNGYGFYDNWCLSALDRLLWDIFRFDNKKPSEEEYLKAMRIYAEDTDYIRKIK